MRVKERMIQLLSCAVLAGFTTVTLAGTSGKSASTQDHPPTAAVDLPTLSGESQDVQRAKGDPSPDAHDSKINNYLFQDEQINLDPNAGNVRVLRTDQKALVNDYVTVTIPISKVDSRELRNVFRTILGLEGGKAEVIKDKTGNQQYLQAIAPAFMVPYLKCCIPELDEEWVHEYDTGSADVYYKAKNRDATDIDFIASNYASDSGFSQVDETNNAVSRIDEPYRIENYLKGAEAVDIPSNQVLLEVKIYEVASNNDLKIGLDYINWKNGPGRNLARFMWAGADGRSHNKVLTSIFDPITGGASPGSVSSELAEREFTASYRAVNYLLTSNYIDFLQVKGQARLINEESQTVTSANTARFSTDDEVVALISSSSTDTAGVKASPVIAGKGGDGTSPRVDLTDFGRNLNNRPAGSTGIFASITPFVGLESMELVICLSLADLNGVAPNGEPIINSRNISTTVRLLDGERYVISGLKRRHDLKETAKAPGIGDIPVLGYLFGGETATKRFDDVVIVVTPHFSLAAQPAIAASKKVDDLKKIVDGGPLNTPSNPIGYDQWMLDKQ